MNLLAQLHACLLGGAVGDSLGLPFEGLPARRARRWARGALRQRFLLGRGMVSDDTDHTVFVAQALLRSAGDVDVFRRVLAWRLRWWLLSLPAGIGLGTLRGILKLWLGLRPSGSGRSAGILRNEFFRGTVSAQSAFSCSCPVPRAAASAAALLSAAAD